MSKVAILLGLGPTVDEAAAVQSGHAPMSEYMALQRRTGGDIISYRACVSPHLKIFDRAPMRVRYLLSILYFLANRNGYSAVYLTGEELGAPVGALLRLTRWKGRIVCVVHAAGSRKSFAFLRAMKRSLIAKLVCVSAAQSRLLSTHLGLRPDQLMVRANWVDTDFFHPPEREAPGEYLFACGSENRDYLTLCRALIGTAVPTKLLASGFHEALSGKAAEHFETPKSVEVLEKVSFKTLAALYRDARFVVVPLNPVEYAAGVTGIVEAMASGKAIVASDSPGVREYLKDGVSGYVVPPGDPAAMRAAIERLWADPEAALTMGRRNRQWIKEHGDVHGYARAIAGELAPPPLRD